MTVAVQAVQNRSPTPESAVSRIHTVFCIADPQTLLLRVSLQSQKLFPDLPRKQFLTCSQKHSDSPRKCPICGVLTERIAGCDYISCSGCNKHWCWQCGDFDGNGTARPAKVLSRLGLCVEG